MTNEQAIAYLKIDKAGHEATMKSDDTKQFWDCVIEAIDMAIEALEEKGRND